MACILLIHMNIFKGSAIQTLMQQKGIRCIAVSEKQEKVTLGELAGMKGFGAGLKRSSNPQKSFKHPAEEMIVFCGLEDAQLDEILAELREHDLRVSLKAVLTPVNAGWNAGQLYGELVQERAAFQNNRA